MSLIKFFGALPQVFLTNHCVGQTLKGFQGLRFIKILHQTPRAQVQPIKMMSRDSLSLKDGGLNGEWAQERPTTITIEGNIGSGKTTLMEYFSKHSNVTVIDEPVQKWRNVRGHNLFDLMYRNPERWSFVFQSYVQLTMLQNHRIQVSTPFKMMERSVYSARYCFVENMHLSKMMSDPEYVVLDELFQWVIDNHNIGQDRIIYLRTSPEQCYERIKLRCREEEEGIPMEYLKALHQRYEEWLMDGKFPIAGTLMVLDGSLPLEEMLKTYQTKKDSILCKG